MSRVLRINGYRWLQIVLLYDTLASGAALGVSSGFIRVAAVRASLCKGSSRSCESERLSSRLDTGNDCRGVW